MTSGTPINRPVQPRFGAGSGLQSPLGSDDLTNQWKKTKVPASSTFNLAGQVAQIVSAELRKRRRVLTPPAAITQTDTFFPFKIYQPDLSQIADFGYILDNQIENLRNFTAIDSTVPTNLPTTINPITDGWRIWAIRDGMYSARNFESVNFQDVVIEQPPTRSTFNIPMSDFSMSGNTGDGAGDLTDAQGLDYDIPSGEYPQTNPVIPIILSGEPDSIGFYSFSIWLAINSTFDFSFGAQICGQQFDTATGTASAFPEPPYGFTGSPDTYQGELTVFPIGIISTVSASNPSNVPTQLSAIQIQLGNCFSQYGEVNLAEFTSDDGAATVYSAGLNYRGDFLNDPNLSQEVFYPGDVVRIQKAISIAASSSGGITTSININGGGDTVYAQNLYLMTTIGFTTDPTTDSNWTLISGVNLTSITTPTPNT